MVRTQRHVTVGGVMPMTRITICRFLSPTSTTKLWDSPSVLPVARPAVLFMPDPMHLHHGPLPTRFRSDSAPFDVALLSFILASGLTVSSSLAGFAFHS